MALSQREIKLCLLGDTAVGKSSIVMRFVRDEYRETLESTIGASFMTKRIKVGDRMFVFQIWDTAGQEKYRSLAPMYYRGAAVAIVVYDVTREATFKAVKDWIHELQKNASSNIVIAIAGNKCDLEDLREVRTQDAKDYADNINAIFTETSALSGINVPEMFTAIAKKLPAEDTYTPRVVTGRNNVNLNQRESRGTAKSSNCCGSKS